MGAVAIVGDAYEAAQKHLSFSLSQVVSSLPSGLKIL
jgi:hypothetical protein